MSRLTKFLSMLLCTALFSTSVNANGITLPFQDSVEDSHASILIAKALAAQNLHAAITHHPQSLSGERLKNAFDDGEIDILWQSGKTVSGTKHHLLNIPVFRGLMNSYRIVARKGDAIPNLGKLRNLEIGMFRDDGIVNPLQQNDYKVIRVKHGSNLTAMLQGERFDVAFMPVARLDGENYLTTSDFIVNVENPWFFIVHESRPDIARALRKGLVSMLENGSLDELLKNTPWMLSLHNELKENQTEVVTLPYVAQPGFEIAQEFMLVDSTSSLLTASF
ncbi:hypothetical protein [Planctobacterium marinum]|uniref:Solute-binding protein family 3/N-terminal domain-containing protein n=1 Tax=Planctobacterium marinum TaxID=1631968 RepID=A0AA48HN75_9ALTE|nr:hypothetical protein MACH26_34070 [Planctobacterium marinum]